MGEKPATDPGSERCKTCNGAGYFPRPTSTNGQPQSGAPRASGLVKVARRTDSRSSDDRGIEAAASYTRSYLG